MAAVLALESADLGTVGAVAKQLESSFAIGHAQLGLLATVSSLVAAAFTIPAGALVDRVARVPLLAASVVLWAGAMLLIGAAGSYASLLLMRLLLGATTATAGPALSSLAGDLFPPQRRAHIYGLILGGELVGAGFGFVISGYVAAALSWRFAFWLMALPALLLAWLLRHYLPEPERGRQGAPATNGSHRPQGGPSSFSFRRAMAYVLSTRTNVLLIVASAIGYFFFSGVRTFAVVFVRNRYQLGQAGAISILAIVGIGAVAGVLFGGRLADRLLARGHRDARLLVAGAAYGAAALLLVPALLLPALTLAMPLFMLGALAVSAANPPLDAARLDIMPPALWGRAESVRTVLRTSAVAAAPLLFGWLADAFGGHGHGLELAYLIMLAPLAVSGLVVWAARRYYAGDRERAQAPSRPREPRPRQRLVTTAAGARS